MANVSYKQIGWLTGSDNQTGFAFTTPSSGATQLTMNVGWAFYSGDQSNSGAWKDGMYVWINNSRSGRSGNAVAQAVWGYDPTSGYEHVEQTINYNFLPNTEYVVWFYTWAGNLTWRVNGTPTFSLSGSYGIPSSVSASNGTFGKGIPITITRAVQSTTHTLKVSCAGKTETLLTNSSATSATWTPSVATYAKLITNAMSASATITCETFINNSRIGSKTTAITVVFAAGSLNPTLSSGWGSIAPYNTGAVSGFTCYVQGYSKIRASFDSSKIATQYDATISEYALIVNSKTYTGSSATSDVITSTGTVDVTLQVKDSRGQTASGVFSCTFLAYQKPVLSNTEIDRCDQDGTINNDGTYVRLISSVSISSLNNENTVTLKGYYARVGGSWSEAQSMTADTALVLSGFSVDISYIVKIEATDRLGNVTTFQKNLSTRSWALKIVTSAGAVASVGIGKAPESNNVLEIPSSWNIRKGTSDALFDTRAAIVNAVWPVGAIYMSISSTSPAALFGGTWERITGCFLLAATDGGGNGGNSNASIRPGYTGGEATHTLAEGEMPSHAHTVYGFQSKAENGTRNYLTMQADGNLVVYTSSGQAKWAASSKQTSTPIDKKVWTAGVDGTTSSKGSGSAHNNMPPYLAVYVWKRTE